jgi:serine/threonine protein kinase
VVPATLGPANVNGGTAADEATDVAGFGDYVLDAKVGEGPRGTVWRGVHIESGRQVAVKELAPALSGDEVFMARYRKLAAKLVALGEHENRVSVLACLEEPGRVWVVEQWVDGRRLDLIAATGDRGFTPEESVAVVVGVLAGLASAKGIVHGDVRPENIVIAADGTPLVTDFGIPVPPDDDGAQDPFRSAEALRGERVDARSDVYSVAAVLHALLGGTPELVAGEPEAEVGAVDAEPDLGPDVEPKGDVELVVGAKPTAQSEPEAEAKAVTEPGPVDAEPAAAAEAAAGAEASAGAEAAAEPEAAAGAAAATESAAADAESFAVDAAPAATEAVAASGPEAAEPATTAPESMADSDALDPAEPGATAATEPEAAQTEPQPATELEAAAEPGPERAAGPEAVNAVEPEAVAPTIAVPEHSAEPEPQPEAATAAEPEAAGPENAVADDLETATALDVETATALDVDATAPVPEVAPPLRAAAAARPVPKLSQAGKKLTKLVQRALSEDPRRRPARAAVFGASLDRLAGECFGDGWREKAVAALAAYAGAPRPRTRTTTAREPLPTPLETRLSRRHRRPIPHPTVLGLALAILLLLGAAAIIVDHRADDSPIPAAAPPQPEATPAEVAGSDIAGTWAVIIKVVESSGFFDSSTGTSALKAYVISSDCSKTPCDYKLTVVGSPGEFALPRVGDDYILKEEGPNDCVDLATGEVRVPAGGVSKVEVTLRPTAARKGTDGKWQATAFAGGVVTTFDSQNPDCGGGAGVQRTSLTGTRQ